MPEITAKQGYDRLVAEPHQGDDWAFTSMQASTADGRGVQLALGWPWLVALLIPIETRIGALVDERSQGVRVGALPSSSLVPRPTLCIQCEDQRLLDVFLSLVDDIVAKVRDLEVSQVNREVEEVLDSWRRLLAAAGNPLPREVAMGLIGEFEVLGEMRSAPEAALRCWGGPRGEIHDFSLPGGSLEVKASSTMDGLTVEISSLDQLMPRDDVPLHLVVHHLRENRQAPSLDQRFDVLVGMGYPSQQLTQLCEGVGYVPGSDPEANRFQVLATRAWGVDDSFPGLRRSDLPQDRLVGVERVRYTLGLSSLLGQELSLHDALVNSDWETA